MANCCLKCGKMLEKDGFCLNCIEFAEKNETMKETTEIDSAVIKDQPYTDADLKAYEQIPNQQLQLKRKSKFNFTQMILVVIIVVGIFAVSKMAGRLDKKNPNDDTGAYQEEVLGQAQIERKDETSFDDVLGEEETDEDTDASYVYEADYEEIMQAGEPSNAYTLFAATKDDVVPIIDEYFIEQGLTMKYDTDMDNTYEMIEDEKVTYYETFSMWSKEEDDSELYLISSDTVTGKLLYVGVYREDKEEAIKLITKSLETIDPSLAKEQLQETYDNIVNSTDYVDEICGDYEVQGGYLEGQNLYYYYISSLLGN